MTDADLDQTYTALCRALGEVGPARAELMLSMVSLALIARSAAAADVLPVIERARDRCLEGPQGPAAGA
jgi:hypothetical protein